VDGLAAKLLNIMKEAVYIILRRFYYKSLACGAVFDEDRLSKISLIMTPRLLVLLAALVLAQGSIAQSGVSFEWVTRWQSRQP
jgi:hypothetical protein